MLDNNNDIREIKVILLTALAESAVGEIHEGIAWIAWMPFPARFTIDDFQLALAELATARLITRGPAHLIRITDDGRKTAAEIERILAEARAARKADA
jgi:hypothetical protein